MVGVFSPPCGEGWNAATLILTILMHVSLFVFNKFQYLKNFPSWHHRARIVMARVLLVTDNRGPLERAEMTHRKGVPRADVLCLIDGMSFYQVRFFPNKEK